ncbi:hypothetical protein SAMN02745589_1125 [Bifidobacterium merycicum DSM 6492]|nr:hypothetical protein SAMN02745589_1125 [Bifidobacterium merycicum DSM 6492]
MMRAPISPTIIHPPGLTRLHKLARHSTTSCEISQHPTGPSGVIETTGTVETASDRTATRDQAGYGIVASIPTKEERTRR